MRALMQRKPVGLVPVSDGAEEMLAKIRMGDVVSVDIVKPRNVHFFRKWWALVKVAFDLWSEHAPTREYQGQRVMPELERFRKDVTILAGFYRPVFNARNEVRLEADSIAFASMDEERFEELYSATVDAILQKVIPQLNLTRDDLDGAVNEVVGFV